MTLSRIIISSLSEFSAHCRHLKHDNHVQSQAAEASRVLSTSATDFEVKTTPFAGSEQPVLRIQSCRAPSPTAVSLTKRNGLSCFDFISNLKPHQDPVCSPSQHPPLYHQRERIQDAARISDHTLSKSRKAKGTCTREIQLHSPIQR